MRLLALLIQLVLECGSKELRPARAVGIIIPPAFAHFVLRTCFHPASIGSFSPGFVAEENEACKAVGEAGAAPVPLSKTLETFDAYLENKVFSTLSLHCTFIKDFVLFFCC